MWHVVVAEKSRVLLSLKEDIEDLYGPRLPDSGWRLDQEQKVDQPPVLEPLKRESEENSAAAVPVITLDSHRGDDNQTTQLQEMQALMHPDISAPAHFLSADHLLNGTTVNESA